MSAYKPLLDAAIERREALQGKLDKLVESPTLEGRSAFDESEERKFEKLTGEIASADDTIKKFRKQMKREEKAAAASVSEVRASETGSAYVTSEPAVYDPENKRGGSYFQDLGTIAASAARLGGGDASAALERMARNQREFEVEMRKADETARRTFDSFVSNEGGSVEKRVNPNTTFGTGGEFVPPLWLVSQYVPLVRPDRVAANRVRNAPLPAGIDVINLPKITVGSVTGVQAGQGGAVASQDIATATVSATVRTLAGQEDISLQLLEQSPLQMDGVIADDLMRDLWQRLDFQILAGSGSNGQHLGVLNVPGATSNTSITNSNYVTVASTVFHDASTAGTQYRSLLNGKNAIETLRIAPATAIWAHPRRVNSWEYSAVDSTYRPLFVPYSPFNALGLDNPNIPEGVAGTLAGLPVIKDGNIPTTMNGTAVTGGTADPVVVVKEDDLILWEGTPRFRALPEILSGTLQIRYQVYQYSAFMPNRFAPSISILTGNTGLAAPGF